jgi:hypothetical protein
MDEGVEERLHIYCQTVKMMRYKSLHIQMIGRRRGFRTRFFPFDNLGGGLPACSSE